MTVSHLDTDVDDTWDCISDRSYGFLAHARILAMLRELSVKDLRKFYEQYVAPSTDSAKSMRARLLVQVVVADPDATDVDASQSLGDALSEASGHLHSSGADADRSSGAADGMGRGWHRPHSGAPARHTGSGGARVGSTRVFGGAAEINIWCCTDVQVSLVDKGSYDATSIPSESELALSQGAVRIVDIDKWKAVQFVYPRSVGGLPR